MDYKKQYDLWLNNTHLTETEIKELKQLDNEEIKESFYRNITFGTGGLRGLMGLGTNRINKYTIRWVTTGLAQYLKVNNLNDGVVIAYDNRLNSQNYAYEAAKVLASLNIKSYIFKELRPTPLLSFAVRQLNASAGIMLTASHNPKEYNGFKVYNKEGAQIIDEEAHAVYSEIKKFEIPFEFDYKNEHLITELDDTIENNYYKELYQILINDNKDKKVKILYSPLHGTGMTMIPPSLKKEGYNVYLVDSQVKADPNFTNALSTNPEEMEAYDEAIKTAKEVDAEILMVTDPDADRIGLGEKDNDSYYIFNGNELAVMMTYYIINESKPTKGSVYKTIVTSDLITKIALDYGLNVVEVLTGFKYIGYWTERLEGPYIFGSEESYGSLVKDFVRDKDAVQAAYLMAEMAETLYSRGLTFKKYMQEINEKYGFYEELTHQITLLGIEGEKTIKKVMDKARKGYFNKLFYDTITIEDFIEGKKFEDGFYLPPSNVIKIKGDDFWVAFRPSGTEPKLKVYFSVFKETKQQAVDKLDEIKNIILENIEEEV